MGLQPKECQEWPTSSRSGGQEWNSFRALEAVRPCGHLDFGLLASRTVKKKFLLFYATQFVGLCSDCPGKQTGHNRGMIKPGRISSVQLLSCV